jgi:hypothetical protein
MKDKIIEVKRILHTMENETTKSMYRMGWLEGWLCGLVCGLISMAVVIALTLNY